MVKYNKKTGFTLAEALISMLIVAIIIGVSMKVFTKKHVKPVYNASHGYYVCYRSFPQDGANDSEGNPAGTVYSKKGAADPVRQEGDSCTFTPVKSANYYVVYAVGGGGGGGTERGGAPGEFKTLFLTNIADSVTITPGSGGAANSNGTETKIEKNNADHDEVLVAEGGLSSASTRITRNIIKKCEAYPSVNFFDEGADVTTFLPTNLVDTVACDYTHDNQIKLTLCNSGDDTNVYQYDDIGNTYNNTNTAVWKNDTYGIETFWERYKRDAGNALDPTHLDNLYDYDNYRYVYDNSNRCLRRYPENASTANFTSALKNEPGSQTYEYCFGSSGAQDKLYRYIDKNTRFLVGNLTNDKKRCKIETASYKSDIYDSRLNITDKDTNIVIRNLGVFKVFLTLHVDLSRSNTTKWMIKSGFGDYLIAADILDNSGKAVLFNPNRRSHTRPLGYSELQWDPSMGDGGGVESCGTDCSTSDAARPGMPGAVFIAW